MAMQKANLRSASNTEMDGVVLQITQNHLSGCEKQLSRGTLPQWALSPLPIGPEKVSR